METMIGVFHTFIASKLREKCGPYNNTLKREMVMKVLWTYKISNSLRNDFLAEMENFKLIKHKDKQNIEVRYQAKPKVAIDWLE